MREITHFDVGRFGEKICVKYAKRTKKFKILAKNYKIGKLEADIIACDKEYLIFIEVKTRRIDKNNLHRPADAVDYKKRTNLIKFAYAYCKRLPDKLKDKTPRIDVCEVFVEVDKKLKVCDINYIENAVHR